MLGIRMPRFLRRFIRKHTMALPEETALKWKTGLSVIYMITCWNIAGYMLYHMMKPKKHTDAVSEEDAKDMNIPPSAYYAHLLDVPNPKVLRYKGGFKFETEPIDVSSVKKMQEVRLARLKQQQVPAEGLIDMTKEETTTNIFEGES